MPTLTFLTRLRPSNLIILFALPFIVWLFVSSPDYGRSLTAIVGVEPGSGRLVPGFLLVLVAVAGGLTSAIRLRRGRRGPVTWVAAAISLGAGAFMALTGIATPFFASVVANAVDPFTSPIVVQGETPRRLTDAALAATAGLSRTALWVYTLGSAAALALLGAASGDRLRRWPVRALLTLNLLPALAILVFAHIGFAAGVATSIRAAILAYGLAIVLGLLWVGLMQLRLHRRTPWIAGGIALAFALLAAWQFSQPRHAYVLAGTLTGKIGIVKDTPDSLIDTVRLGLFPGGPDKEVPIRSYAAPDAALSALAEGGQITGALLPAASARAGLPVLWQAESLPDGARVAGSVLAVLAIVTALLTFGGAVHRRHPLSVGAEFIIDTIRGIPMLVIVLYIGLPLAGAVKDASGGFIDPPNLLRGIVAMAVAYSAYLAEIFRSGINAVPTGQIEAARSLGLTRLQTARHVILPQAFRIIIPPLGNEFIAILKDTSLLSILSIRDITQRMREFQSASFLPFAPYNSAAIFYVLLTLVAASLVASVERKYHVHRR